MMIRGQHRMPNCMCEKWSITIVSVSRNRFTISWHNINLWSSNMSANTANRSQSYHKWQQNEFFAPHFPSSSSIEAVAAKQNNLFHSTNLSATAAHIEWKWNWSSVFFFLSFIYFLKGGKQPRSIACTIFQFIRNTYERQYLSGDAMAHNRGIALTLFVRHFGESRFGF